MVLLCDVLGIGSPGNVWFRVIVPNVMEIGTYLGRLRARSRERYFEADYGAPPPVQDVDEWVLGRRYCHYFSCILPEGLGPARRREVLRLQALQASPFERTGMTLHFEGQKSAAFMWDEDRVTDAIRDAGLDSTRVSVMPETALREPGADGLRLIDCLEGCEGQVWRDGWLVSSRWWGKAPSSIEWQRFQRSAGPALDDYFPDVPSAEEVAFLDHSWTKSGLLVAFNYQALPLRRLGLAAAAFPLIVLAYGIGHLALYQIETSRLAAGAEELEATSVETLGARRAALQNTMAVKSLLALDPFPDQLSLMSAVSKVLGRRGIRVEEWRYQNGDLEITLAGKNRLDATFFVGAFEKSSMFHEVAAKSTPNATSLKLILKVNGIVG